MEASEILGPLASTMGVCMSLAPLFQLRRVLDRQQADDVSQIFLVIIAIGASAWLAYGISIDDIYLVIPNAVGVVTNLATLVVVRRYSARTTPTPP